MIYPEVLIINGDEYEINTDYETALACFSCAADTDISETERALGIIGLLYKEPPDDLTEALRLAIRYLQCGKVAQEEDRLRTSDMDFDHDMNYIRSSFRSDYGLDLSRMDYMHWWEFSELLQGLTDNCILNRVRDIRNYDTSGVKDPKAKQRILQAKSQVALPKKISQEEQKTLDDFYSQLK